MRLNRGSIIPLQLESQQVTDELLIGFRVRSADCAGVSPVGEGVHRHKLEALVKLPFQPELPLFDVRERRVPFRFFAALVVVVASKWPELPVVAGDIAVHHHGIAAV